MTQQELYNLLLMSSYPVVYHSFKASNEEPVDPPYIVYSFVDSDNISADNKVSYKRNSYRVELYTNQKNLEAEESLEKVFDNASIFYDKSEVYIESETMFQISYNIEI